MIYSARASDHFSSQFGFEFDTFRAPMDGSVAKYPKGAEYLKSSKHSKGKHQLKAYFSQMASLLFGMEVTEILFGVQLPIGDITAETLCISGLKLPSLLFHLTHSEDGGVELESNWSGTPLNQQ